MVYNKLVAGIPVSVKLKGYSASELQLNTRNEILSAMAVYGFLSYHDGQLRIPDNELAGGICEEAITQIKERNYLQKVADCNELLLVGINYDKAKHHKCRIEKIVGDIR